MKSNTFRHRLLRVSVVYSLIMALLFGWLMLKRPPAAKNPAANRRLVQAILHNDTEEVRAALKAGADPNIEMEGSSWSDFIHPLASTLTGVGDTHLNDTPFLLTLDSLVKRDANAVRSNNTDIPLENLEIVKALVEAGADVNARSRIGETVLQMAVDWRYGDTAHYLLEHKANPNLAEAGGMTPCHSAASGGDTKMVKDLLDHGANPNAKDILGMTPIFHAALPPETPQQIEIVKILLQYHADPTVKDESSRTVLAHAQQDHRPGIAKLLQRNSVPPPIPSP